MAGDSVGRPAHVFERDGRLRVIGRRTQLRVSEGRARAVELALETEAVLGFRIDVGEQLHELFTASAGRGTRQTNAAAHDGIAGHVLLTTSRLLKKS